MDRDRVIFDLGRNRHLFWNSNMELGMFLGPKCRLALAIWRISGVGRRLTIRSTVSRLALLLFARRPRRPLTKCLMLQVLCGSRSMPRSDNWASSRRDLTWSASHVILA